MVSYQSLPKSPGVYFFKNNKGEIIYIGKAKSLRDRVSSYFTSTDLLPKTRILVSEISLVDCIPTDSEIDAFLLEANMIRRWLPKYNISLKDGKSYPLIEITIKDQVPLVRIVRREKSPSAIYFGPFPTGTDLSNLMRFLRRIFPYVSQNHQGNKTCLRSHLGLCPCPEVFTDHAVRRNYRRNLKMLISFLKGDRMTVQKYLEKQMQRSAALQNYEEAASLKYKLQKIAWLTAPRTTPWEYETNPNLLIDRSLLALSDLKHHLGLEKLHQIECYDVSTLSGQSATGAQVTFIDGQAEKSLYRHYRIKLKPSLGGSNDYAMLQEMLQRRLKSSIPLPDLVVIDGGAGQVAATKTVLQKIPSARPEIIGLSKRLETIHLVDGKTIQLEQSSPALQLLQQMRDEAHRFSRRYHFFLRSQKMVG